MIVMISLCRGESSVKTDYESVDCAADGGEFVKTSYKCGDQAEARE